MYPLGHKKYKPIHTMKMKLLAISALVAASMSASCEKDLVSYSGGDIMVSIEAGSEWLHDFPLFLGIKTKNPPQIAIWTESPDGEYLETIYATRRGAEGAWRGGTDRPEALPAWNFARGADASGVAPVADGISGATPKASFDVKMRPVGELRRFTVKVEINHSADWNDSWPEGAAKGSENYSGESGQPALVYAAAIDLDTPRRSYTAQLIGYSSPDGTDGLVRPDTSCLTSALSIAKRITIYIR